MPCPFEVIIYDRHSKSDMMEMEKYMDCLIDLSMVTYEVNVDKHCVSLSVFDK